MMFVADQAAAAIRRFGAPEEGKPLRVIPAGAKLDLLIHRVAGSLDEFEVDVTPTSGRIRPSFTVRFKYHQKCGMNNV